MDPRPARRRSARGRLPGAHRLGSRDLLLPRRQAARFVRALPHAELRLLPGVGHLPMADAPQLIASAILDFIAKTEPTTPQHSGS
jgi:pimeloyl-ACP methyl ester carboxylesterase